MVGPFGCQGTLLTHIQLAINPNPQISFLGLLSSFSSSNLDLVIAQLPSLSRSHCKASLHWRESTVPPSLVSLANSLNVHSIPVARSFIETLKSTGPKIEPWGTPLMTGHQPDVHVFPVLRAPELDAVLQVGSHQSGVEGQNHLPRPAGHAAFDAAQDMVGFLGCEHTLQAHVQLFIHQYPQVLLRRAALNPFIPQPVLIPGVVLTQVQDFALGLVEPHEVSIGPLLKFVQVALDGIPSL
ncbi:hypothetical protein QYF61_011862, partial [Mycteria americana]